MPPKKKDTLEFKGSKGGKSSHLDPETTARLAPALEALQGGSSGSGRGRGSGGGGGGGLDLAQMMAMLGGGGGGGQDRYEEPKTDAVFDEDLGAEEEDRDRIRAAFRRASRECKADLTNQDKVVAYEPLNKEWRSQQENYEKEEATAEEEGKGAAEKQTAATALADSPRMEWKIIETFRAGPGSQIKEGVIAMIVYEGTMYAEKMQPRTSDEPPTGAFKERKLVVSADVKDKKKVGTIRCHMIRTHQCGAVAKILDEHSEELHNVGCFYHKVSDIGMSDSVLPPSKWIDYLTPDRDYNDCEWSTQEVMYVNKIEVEEDFLGTGAGLFMLNEAHQNLQGPAGVTYVKIDPLSKMDDGTMESRKGVEIENCAANNTKFIDATVKRLKNIYTYYRKISFNLFGDPSGKGGLFLTSWQGYNTMPCHYVNKWWFVDIDFFQPTMPSSDLANAVPPPSTNVVKRSRKAGKTSEKRRKLQVGKNRGGNSSSTTTGGSKGQFLPPTDSSYQEGDVD